MSSSEQISMNLNKSNYYSEIDQQIANQLKFLSSNLQNHCIFHKSQQLRQNNNNASIQNYSSSSLQSFQSSTTTLFKKFSNIILPQPDESILKQNSSKNFHCYGHGTCESSNFPELINQLSKKADNSSTAFLDYLKRINSKRDISGDHCVCLIHYTGNNCEIVNNSFFDAWKWIYLSLAIIVVIQLLTNIIKSICRKKGKNRTLVRRDNEKTTTSNSSKINSSLSLEAQNQSVHEENSIISENARNQRNHNTHNKPVKYSFYQLLTRVSAQKVLYSLVILACLFRAFDFHIMKKNLSNPVKSVDLENYNLVDLNQVSLEFRHAQPQFLVSLFYIFVIISLVLVICYWSECFFVPDFSQSIERKPCQGVFLYKSSIAFVCFTSVLGFSTIGQFLVSSAAKLIKQDEKLSSFINIIFLLCIAVLMFAVHVAFLTIGVEIYFKLNGAFCFKQHKERARDVTGSNSDANAIATAKLLQPFRKQHSKSIESPSIDNQRTNLKITIEGNDDISKKTKNTTISQNQQQQIENKKYHHPAGPDDEHISLAASGTQDHNNNKITTTYFSSKQPEKHFNNSTNSIQSSCTTTDSATTTTTTCFFQKVNKNSNNNNHNNTNNNNLDDDSSFFPAIGTIKSETICARLGLILQGLLTLFLSLFIASDIMRAQWIDTIDTNSKSTYLVFFRITEFAVLVWFPACLWHPTAPESLWILNPRTLLKGSQAALDLSRKRTAFYLSNFKAIHTTSRFRANSNKSSEDCSGTGLPRSSNYTSTGSLSESGVSTSIQRVKFSRVRKIFQNEQNLDEENNEDENENFIKQQNSHNSTNSSDDGLCYICCDPENKEGGKIIRPCNCRTVVHHECLKKFIISELTNRPELQNLSLSPERMLEQSMANNNSRHSSSESDSRSGTTHQRNRPGSRTNNNSDKVLRCKVCQKPYRISTQGIDFGRAFKKCNFVLVILTLVAAGLMPYLAWYLYNFMAKNEWHKLWQVIDVSLVIIFEYGCLKLLGFNLVRVYIAAQQGAMKIMDLDSDF